MGNQIRILEEVEQLAKERKELMKNEVVSIDTLRASYNTLKVITKAIDTVITHDKYLGIKEPLDICKH